MKKSSKTLLGFAMLCQVVITPSSTLFAKSAYIIPGGHQTILLNTTTKQPFKLITMENNKEVIRRLFEDALNKRNMGLLTELVSADYTSSDGDKGAAAMEKTFRGLIKAFPDLQWHIKELFAESEKVFASWDVQGTNTGQYQVFAPTGKNVTGSGMGVFTFKDGKIVQSDVQTDRLGFLQALDILPRDLSHLNSKKITKDAVVLIDKFIVPRQSIDEFSKQANYNSDFIKRLAGLIEQEVFKSTDDQGNLIIVTTAVWENEAAFENAKKAVFAEFQRIGFNPSEFVKRLNVGQERGIYCLTD